MNTQIHRCLDQVFEAECLPLRHNIASLLFSLSDKKGLQILSSDKPSDLLPKRVGWDYMTSCKYAAHFVIDLVLIFCLRVLASIVY